MLQDELIQHTRHVHPCELSAKLIRVKLHRFFAICSFWIFKLHVGFLPIRYTLIFLHRFANRSFVRISWRELVWAVEHLTPSVETFFIVSKSDDSEIATESCFAISCFP